MDCKMIGSIIARLRRQNGMTQEDLAQKLNISDKAVSRWENGHGYPEITQFPALATLFGVTIDFLMTGQRRGITVAGNIMTDQVKSVQSIPEPGMLSKISGVSRSVGGCAANTAIALAEIDRRVPVSLLGCIGDDEQGRYILSQMRRRGINADHVSILPDCPTSFSDVMRLPSGERVCFHAQGANARFSPDMVDMATLSCSLLHIGYILLLDCFDEADPEYGTVMARFLREVQQRGIKTSIDVVSEDIALRKKTVLAALKYCDYAIINESECCALTGLPARNAGGKLIAENLRASMEAMTKWGVREKVIVHSYEAGFCLDVPSGSFTAVPSLQIPESHILGKVGAGDTFCAGCLYSLYNDFSDEAMLRFASSAAACSLLTVGAVDGIRPWQEINKMEAHYPRRRLPQELLFAKQTMLNDKC